VAKNGNLVVATIPVVYDSCLYVGLLPVFLESIFIVQVLVRIVSDDVVWCLVACIVHKYQTMTDLSHVTCDVLVSNHVLLHTNNISFFPEPVPSINFSIFSSNHLVAVSIHSHWDG